MSGLEGLELGALLGSGGFADVYEAEEIQLGRRVAVKLFRARVDGMDRKSFEREAQAMGRLSGVRNIVHVYRSGVSDDEHPFLVMERMEYPMSTLVGDERLEVSQVLRTGALMGRALMVAHDEGILHRDLKPANILVDRYGEPALSDFGISTMMRSEDSSTVYGFSTEHAAPELFEQSRATPAADLYSLATTLYTLLEGRPPFERDPSEGPLAFMTRVQRDPPPSSPTLAAADPNLDELLVAAMGKHPVDRPELAHFVDALTEASPSLDEPATGRTDPRHTALPTSAGTEPGDAPSDTVVAGGAGRTGIGASSPPEAPGPGRKRPLLLVALAATLLLAAGAIATAVGALGGESPTSTDPEVAEEAESDGSGSGTDGADGTDGAGSATRLSGVGNVRPLHKGGVFDTSDVLRSRIDEFAATTTSPVVRNAAAQQHMAGSELDFGELPSLIDYGAFNKSETPECYSMLLHDVEVLGAARSMWTDGSEVVLIFAAQFGSPEDAQEYFWASALFAGVDSDGCAGWPDEGPLVDPEDPPRLERADFELGAEADDLLTAIQHGVEEGGFQADVSYSAIARHGAVTLVAGSARFEGTGDPEQHRATLQEAVAAFGAA